MILGLLVGKSHFPPSANELSGVPSVFLVGKFCFFFPAANDLGGVFRFLGWKVSFFSRANDLRGVDMEAQVARLSLQDEEEELAIQGRRSEPEG